jgi:hypothetical protein
MVQIAKEIFLKQLSQMKNILDLEQFRLGSKDEQFKYFKKKVMNEFYEGMLDVFQTMEDAGVLTLCECNSYVRNGYNDCQHCNGAGYRNSDDQDKLASDIE